LAVRHTLITTGRTGPVARAPLVPALVRMQVWRAILMIGAKALPVGKPGREAARERNRRAVLEKIARKLREKEGTAADA